MDKLIQIIFFLFALSMPWVLGFVLIKPFLTQRKGYVSFAIGAGYVLGWFVATLILRVYDCLGRPFNIYEVVAIECVIVLLLSFFKTKKISIDRIQVQITEPNSKLINFLSGIIILLLIYQWGLTIIDLLSKPIFPWDGWLSWSAKAKIFYYYKEIPLLSSDFEPFWQFVDSRTVSTYGARHPYFISLVQAYAALAWGNWNDSTVNLPWLGANIALFICVYGGLRQLHVGRGIALLAGYLVVSLPIVDAHTSLGAYADLWVGFAMLITVLLLTIFLSFREWWVVLPLLAFATIVYLTKHTALIFIVSLLLVIFWYFLGFLTLMLMVTVFFIGLYSVVSTNWLHNELSEFFQQYFFGLYYDMIQYNPVAEQVWAQWGMLDNFHYAFIAGIFSLTLLLFQKISNKQNLLVPLIVSGLSLFLTMLVISFFTSKMSDVLFTGYFNRVSLYFMPVFVLLPFGIYHSDFRSLCFRVRI